MNRLFKCFQRVGVILVISTCGLPPVSLIESHVARISMIIEPQKIVAGSWQGEDSSGRFFRPNDFFQSGFLRTNQWPMVKGSYGANARDTILRPKNRGPPIVFQRAAYFDRYRPLFLLIFSKKY